MIEERKKDSYDVTPWHGYVSKNFNNNVGIMALIINSEVTTFAYLPHMIYIYRVCAVSTIE